jgi:pilus assembly protein CpaB
VLFVALGVSLVGTLFVYSRIKHQLARGAATKIVVCSVSLEPGTQLTENQLTMAEWPASMPLEGAFKNPADVVGRILVFPAAAKEPIREQLLATPGSAIGLTAKIPEGMRAVAVVTNELNNVSGFLFPGSHVDVLVTLKQDAAGGPQQAITTTVLQNVEVLSTGEKLQPDPSGKPQNVKVVTVLLNPDDAQKLMLANNEGTVQFVMRNGADVDQVDSRPVDIRQLRGPLPAMNKAPKSTAPPKVAAYEVETFDGAKKSIVKF